MRPPVTTLAIHAWKEHCRPRPWQDPPNALHHGSDSDDPTRLGGRLASIRVGDLRGIPRSWSQDESLAAHSKGSSRNFARLASRSPTKNGEFADEAGCFAPSQGTAVMADRALTRSVSHDTDLRVVTLPHAAHDTTDGEESSGTAFTARGLHNLLDTSDEDDNDHRATTEDESSDGFLSDCGHVLVRAAAARSEQAVAHSLVTSVSDDALKRYARPNAISDRLQSTAQSDFRRRRHHSDRKSRPPPRPRRNAAGRSRPDGRGPRTYSVFSDESDNSERDDASVLSTGRDTSPLDDFVAQSLSGSKSPTDALPRVAATR
mmetsp:Transcript_856/g.1946  ORF Transcript_856/g.1946 Transcript_856/m.1946 type:complete len:318 (+) Transcript_856:208-1161(+)|eukprot:CAMPEP_0198309096 /NCGR_PEP_ID=MMETSP1450-20131203/1562_1 /TAXON_ID=753684 ORGANISM="Madagascaria erythrocladiodes, Strain CCMP3234" /NCGR_SAMPLE_ID=MMETSP1450 /ASSEMBLY_ACC=CAM_ASM_001115 /LENGTH=317 /DNA_ID=CAMNT_0044011831 /DNA_START=178 /DNA_END=1131 /DNA_ORIENTATION=-